jgi:2-polyprenyl-6-methoxyphenol hydroxylase-like FAD-dependent oxidoreductase
MSKDSTRPHVLISGASIAGPALAYWLHRYGFEVTIVERSKALRPGGYGVDIRGAAADVIERMGVKEQVCAADTAMQGTHLVDADGQLFAQLSAAAIGNEHGVDIEIMRDDLSRILYNLSKSQVSYIWNDSITSLVDQKDGVHVSFQHAEPQTFDFVIGADGQHSNVRRLAFGEESQFTHPLGSYISIFTTDNFLGLDHKELIYTAPGLTAGMYSARGNSEAKGIFIFNSKPLEYDIHDTAAQKQIVAEVFANEKGWRVPELLKRMHSATDFYFDAMAQIHMETLSKGRVTLVGDAGYGASPASGQGTSLALVGAYILAGELKRADGNYTHAFTRYEEQMRPFIQKNQKLGVMMAKNMVESSAGSLWMRNQFMHIPGFMGFLQKLGDKKVAEVKNAVEIKEY